MLLAACSKDSTSTSSTANNDNGGSVSNNPLIGMWSQDEVQTTSNAYRDKTYQFIDDETVIYYGRCWNTGGESYGMTKSPLSFDTPPVMTVESLGESRAILA